MNGYAALVTTGIIVGCATYLVATLRARRYAEGTGVDIWRDGKKDLRGMAWIALAAFAALNVYMSLEFMARMKEKEAELTRRQTIVTTLDNRVRVYREGIEKLHTTLRKAKSPNNQELVGHLEAILADIHKRERIFP